MEFSRAETIKELRVIGLDIGTITLKLVGISEQGEVIREVYIRHHGEIWRAIEEAFAEAGVDPTSGIPIGVSGTLPSGGSLVFETIKVDPVQALLGSIRLQFPKAQNILDLGGASVSFIRLDESGRFLGLTGNSLCAAGTGAFLDEQALRMNLSQEVLDTFDGVEKPPSIATRCAVFAKSDLIHRQQEGHSKEAMWTGLCKGMTSTFFTTLLKGKIPEGETVVVGGVSQNRIVIKELIRLLGEDTVTWPEAHMAIAHGAALQVLEQKFQSKPRRVKAASLAVPGNGTKNGKKSFSNLVSRLLPIGPKSKKETGYQSKYDIQCDLAGFEQEESVNRVKALREPLEFKLTKYPDFSVHREWVTDDKTEVRLHKDLTKIKSLSVFMGIDIGSTSNKSALISEDGEIIADVYRKTGGDPIGSTRMLFEAVEGITETTGCKLVFRGVGTTGSGRNLVGKVIGADWILNEITAHVTGAMSVDPTIDTIFEIGGQDAKYMYTPGGSIRDANMNYVCAAGTGSFIEEQTNRLGFTVHEIGPKVMGISPPHTSDRCTVFMEQDMHRLLKEGYSREEVVAAVMYSVIQNYLSKVVENRPYSKERVFFQGATARNQGLVAALENLLGVEVVVSPLCHVMGALGIALAVRERIGESKSAFLGLDLRNRNIQLNTDVCTLCNNECRISTAVVEGADQHPSWGYQCGRDPDSQTRKIMDKERAFQTRQRIWRKVYEPIKAPKGAPLIGIPRTLSVYTYLPYYRTLLTSLGAKIRLTRETSESTAQKGSHLVAGDYCFPAKVAHGHVAELVESKVDYIFVPNILGEDSDGHSRPSRFCPYVEVSPALIGSALRNSKLSDENILSPVIDFSTKEDELVSFLAKVLSEPLNVGEEEIRQAHRKGLEAQSGFVEECRAEGQAMLDQLEEDDEQAIVVIGRPYAVFDSRVSCSLPKRVAERGMKIIPLDFLPYKTSMDGSINQNMFWAYGRRIIHALEFAAKHKRLHPIVLTCFSCGPDSFLLSYADEIMGEQPYLVLELDEHGSDGGYLTRIEAFLDVLGTGKSGYAAGKKIYDPEYDNDDLRSRRIWMPNMPRIGAKLFSAAFRGYGYDAEALPVEDRDAYELGRSNTRGSECLPMSVTAGGFINVLKKSGGDGSDHALFMPTADGPCRFGQYCVLDRLILNRLGYDKALVISPSSTNGYRFDNEGMRIALWKSFILSDIIQKLILKTRPYEVRPGSTDELAQSWIARFEHVLENQHSIEPLVSEMSQDFSELKKYKISKPLVGIVGEIFVRLNSFSNDHVIRAIEAAGGEAWMSPLTEWIHYTTYLQDMSLKKNLGTLIGGFGDYIGNRFMEVIEHRMWNRTGSYLEDRREPSIDHVLEKGGVYFPIEFEGESILTVGRTLAFFEQGASLVVNCSPFGCMHGVMTSGIFQEIQSTLGYPVVNNFYDGEEGLNQDLHVFLKNLPNRTQPATKKSGFDLWKMFGVKNMRPFSDRQN